MSKVLVVGDTHQTHDIHKLRHLKADCEAGRTYLTKDDYVIICGDFGLLWSNAYMLEHYEESGQSIESNTKDEYWNHEELELLKWYNDCPWTTLFVDG